MSQSESNLAQHYKVLTKLAKSESMRIGDLASSLQEITEAAAHTLDCARVNIWLYDEGRTKICCIDHYDLSSREHSRIDTVFDVKQNCNVFFNMAVFVAHDNTPRCDRRLITGLSDCSIVCADCSASGARAGERILVSPALCYSIADCTV